MKSKLLAAALAFPLMGYAQIIGINNIEKVDVPAETPTVAAMSPNGDFLLLTSSTNNGLVKYDIATKTTKKITDANGAGYGVKLSQDGKKIVYRETSFSKDNLRKVALHSMNLSTGEKKELVKATRNLQGYAVDNASATAIDNGKKLTRAIASGVATQELPQLSIDNAQLMITRNGTTSVFSPNGTDKSYIWPEISPDGKRILYYVSGMGAYTCNLEGKDIIPLGIVRAPKWYNNSTVIGMDDKDDGEFIYASSIVAVTLDGKRQTLTPDSIVAMYPQTSLTGDKISFSTPKGETYIINVSK